MLWVFLALPLVALLVFVHELGHFLAAKACGVHVTEFSLGFGRRVWGFTHKGTDYRVCLLPFGGYVRMAGADPFGLGDEDDDILDDPERAFLRRPVWQRLIVVAAGPAMNLLLPVVVFTALLMGGEPQPSTSLGGIQPDSAAEQAGVEPGDRVISVDGVDVNAWLPMHEMITGLNAGQIPIEVERGGRRVPLTLVIDDPGATPFELGFLSRRPSPEVAVGDPKSPVGLAGLKTGDTLLEIDGREIRDWVDVRAALSQGPDQAALVWESDGKRQQGTALRGDWLPLATGRPSPPEASFGLMPATLVVGTVGETVDKRRSGLFSGSAVEDAPAHVAGLRPGDVLLRMDNSPLTSWQDVLMAVRDTMDGEGEQATARPIKVEVLRSGALMVMTLDPIVIEDVDPAGIIYHRPILGVTRLGSEMDAPVVRKYYQFPEAVTLATRESIALAGFIFEHLGRLVTGEAAFQKSVGGPVKMVEMVSVAAEEGVFRLARLLGGLSISLGIVNFLPVPVLDGGQFLFYLLEGIRGRPLSLALRERAQQVGVLFLVLLMLTVLVSDIHGLIVK